MKKGGKENLFAKLKEKVGIYLGDGSYTGLQVNGLAQRDIQTLEETTPYEIFDLGDKSEEPDMRSILGFLN